MQVQFNENALENKTIIIRPGETEIVRCSNCSKDLAIITIRKMANEVFYKMSDFDNKKLDIVPNNLLLKKFNKLLSLNVDTRPILSRILEESVKYPNDIQKYKNALALLFKKEKEKENNIVRLLAYCIKKEKIIIVIFGKFNRIKHISTYW